MKSMRDCDNPKPKNGGRYCVGTRVKYQSCGTQDCSENPPDYREEQCAAYNNNNLNIHGVPSSVEWVPKYGRKFITQSSLYIVILNTAHHCIVSSE